MVTFGFKRRTVSKQAVSREDEGIEPRNCAKRYVPSFQILGGAKSSSDPHCRPPWPSSNNSPSPSRGGSGWGWGRVCVRAHPHPPPVLPLERGGTYSGRSLLIRFLFMAPSSPDAPNPSSRRDLENLSRNSGQTQGHPFSLSDHQNGTQSARGSTSCSLNAGPLDMSSILDSMVCDC